MKIKDPTVSWDPPTHWKNFGDDRIQEWLDSLEMLLRYMDWAFSILAAILCVQDTMADTKIKGFLLSALVVGFINPDELRHIENIVGMIRLREPIDSCLELLRKEFKR